MIDLPKRFWDKVKRGAPDECWEWIGAHNADGYGSFALRHHHTVGAHRLVALGTNCTGMPQHVMHVCDNPPCVNPAHLRTGTNVDNVLDSKHKGRRNRPFGERNGFAKLTEKKVREIRAAYKKAHAGGLKKGTIKPIAIRYQIGVSTLYKVVTRMSWAHV